ncbi:MAG: hypothetical protein H3Z52_10415 [archaeon]|nr:hypothetical protein [archaeon]
MSRIEKYRDKVINADRTLQILDTLYQLSLSKNSLLKEGYAQGLSVDVDLQDKKSYDYVLRVILYRKPATEYEMHGTISKGISWPEYLNIIGVHRHKHYPLADNIKPLILKDLEEELIEGDKARLVSANVLLELPPYIISFILANHGYWGIGLDFTASIPLSKRKEFRRRPKRISLTQCL